MLKQKRYGYLFYFFRLLFIQLKKACRNKVYVYLSFNLSFNKEDKFVIPFIINTIVMFLAFDVIVFRLLSEGLTDIFKAILCLLLHDVYKTSVFQNITVLSYLGIFSVATNLRLITLKELCCFNGT
jgi:hypothetical protein